MLRNPLLLAQVRILLVLNEVLSLNAQESFSYHYTLSDSLLLNEVLSLNAQECIQFVQYHAVCVGSSMKS